MKHFFCIIGIHEFIEDPKGDDPVSHRSYSEGKLAGFTIREKCRLCGETREKYYKKGCIKYWKSRTWKNTKNQKKSNH